MKKLTFAKMSNKTIQIYSKSLPLFSVYARCVRPYLNSENLNLQTEISLSRPTITIKDDNKLSFTNNFELFTRLKQLDERNFDHRILLYDELSNDDYNIKQSFYELIDCILRHTKSILEMDKYQITEIYNQLNKNLTAEDCQDLFNVNRFSTVRYCELINISESTFHRYKRAQK